MAEYIDRNVAIARVTALEVKEPFATMLDVRRDLADIPAADVAPVVRCRDCKWYESAHEVCELTSNGPIKNFVGENAFCSYGEKSEDMHEFE